MEGRGGTEDGLTDGGAWSAGMESRSGGGAQRRRRMVAQLTWCGYRAQRLRRRREVTVTGSGTDDR
jgi:hypothetical protein